MTFSWDVQNVRAVYFHREGEPWQDHGVPGQATQRECPPVRTNYVLRVTKLDDTVDVRKITIYVEAAPEAPDIARFTVDPPNQITLGQCVSMRWEVKGSVSSIKLTANGGTLWDTAPTSGSYEDCPSAAGTVAYGIEAEGSGGTSRGQQNINVVQAATATPVPTPAPEQPAIYSFAVTPNQITDGECVDINWSAGGGTSYVRVLRNDRPIVDDGPLTGHGNDCPTPAGSYTYRLEAFNPVGQSVSQQQAVNVTAAAVQNPLADTFWEATVVGTEAVLSGTRLTAAFDRSGQVNGSSGCNTYSASYSVDRNTLLIGSPSATGQECVDPPFIMDQENAFLRGLSTASSFTRDADRLRITTEVGTIEFVPVGP